MWLGLFVDGPLAGSENDRTFFGEWQRELYFMPHPAETGWILVGTSSLVPAPAWPGQIHYVRNDERSQLLPMEQPGENEGWAIYELAVE